MEIEKRINRVKNAPIKASRSVSLSIEHILRVERFCAETERSFSNGVDFLIGKGLYYIRKVQPDMEKEIDRRVKIEMQKRDGPKTKKPIP